MAELLDQFGRKTEAAEAYNVFLQRAERASDRSLDAMVTLARERLRS
jgi:hypothetical protein